MHPNLFRPGPEAARSARTTPARSAVRLVAILGLLAAVALAGTTGWTAPASAGGAVASEPAAHASSVTSAARSASGSPAAYRPTAGPSANCSALSEGWALFDGDRPAPAIRASLETPCTLDPDVAGLYFVSNASGSGARTEFDLSLPANGTGSARDYSAFWIGMWVGGIDCSYGAASYLTVELIPPFAAGAGVAGVPYWTVEAPAWDLVPAGSCDPQCQNDTAFFTIEGRAYCEDDAVINGFGALSSTGHGAFQPGDLLDLTLDGAAGSTTPLAVYLNDTTDPASSLAWNYSGNTTTGVPLEGARQLNYTVTADPLVPFYANATPGDGGWTGGLDIGYGWYGCPTPSAGDSFSSACDSYAGGSPLLASPEIDSVASWNATSHAYANVYGSVETVSSSGACAGAAGMPSCADFTTYGGSGVYPVFGLGTALGHSWYTFAPTGTPGLFPFGSVAGEFAANGTLAAPIDPVVLGTPSIVVGTGSASIAFRATDPIGTSRAWVTTWWCSSGSVATEATYPASISPTLGNTPQDGNWTAAASTSTYTGSFYYWVETLSVHGALTTGPIEVTILTTGTSGACGERAPPAPALNLSAIAPVAGGYSLSWSGNFSAGVTSYSIEARPVKGGAPIEVPVGNVTSARLDGLAGNASYNLTVIAVNPTGLAASSNAVVGPLTYYPLVYRLLNFTDSSPWAGLAVLHLSANVTGGLPPFEFEFSFGDGTAETVWTTSGAASAIHAFPKGYSGVAVLSLKVDDSAGDTISPAPLYIAVQGPPTAVPATMVGASSFVSLHWSLPASPVPVAYYEIFWTTDPAWAPYLTSAWPTNASVPAISSAILGVDRTSFHIGAADGTAVYAEIVAFNSYGEGLLGNDTVLGEQPYLEAIASAIVGTMSPSAPGGPAPLPESFNASFSLQPGDRLENATYRFSIGAPIPATIAGANGSFWANASTVLDRPGLVEVYLYVTDTIGQATTLFASVYVAPGPAPHVTVTVAPTPVWANASVELSAAASAGSGTYGYRWSFGDGGTAPGNPVNYSYDAAGTYLVNVVVNDTVWGGTTTTWVPVTVYAPPTVTIAETSTATYGAYRFAALPHGGYGSLSYTWLFDDGTSGTGENVTHSWSTAGNYTITLQATDGYGHTATASIAVDIPTLPSVPSTSGSGAASATLVGALVVLVIALAVVAAVLAIRSRRAAPAPPPAPAEPTEGGEPWPEAAEPAAAPPEEEPPELR